MTGVKLRACGSAMSVIITLGTAIWWAAAAIVFTRFLSEADAAAVPASSWREAVCILSWVEAGLWGLSLIVHTMLGMLKCCARRSYAGNAGGGAAAAPTRPTAPPAGDDPQQQFMTSAV